jgi:hypothetical protein
MRMHQVTIAIILLAGSLKPAAAEEYRGTFAQQMACTPDVMRLCGSAIPDVTRIVACLRQNELQLGASCRAVFASNAEATPGDLAARPPSPATVPGAVSPPAR